MRSKPLTYNRFRAYLRFKLRAKKFSKKRIIFTIAFYFLCSLTIFLLPYDILTKYPYLKHFTDFMDFIPAIKLMESKTYAPELCKFYASYMFVVGVGVFAVILRDFFVYCANGMLRPYSQKGVETLGGVGKMVKHPIKYSIIMVGAYALMLSVTYGFLNGGMIGYTRRGHWNTYFIDDYFEMIFYIDFWQSIIIFYLLLSIGFLVTIIDTIFYRRFFTKIGANNER